MDKGYLGWTDFYMEFADKLLLYANDRKTLIVKIKNVYNTINMRLPKLEKDNNIIDIDPFTIYGLFNKGITNANRIKILQGFAQEFSMKAAVPENFDGIPVVMAMSATFYHFIGKRQDNDIDNLWRVFIAAMEYAGNPSEENKLEFIESYDMVMQQKGVKWNLTMGLYWIRPYVFMNLDSRNRWFICEYEKMPEDYVESLDSFEYVPDGKEYLSIVENTRTVLEQNDLKYKNFPELSYYAWLISEKVNEHNRQHPDKPIYEIFDDTNVTYNQNTILYGPPGTGKTYNTAIYAVAICNGEDIETVQKWEYSEVMNRYKELQAQGRIAFTTFHQSYGYEEFIEGIKPQTKPDSKDIFYEVVSGIFKEFCEKAESVEVKTDTFEVAKDAVVWKATIRNEVAQDCYENNRVRIDWGMDSEGAAGFVQDIKKGDIIIVNDGSRSIINGIAVIVSDDAFSIGTQNDATTRNVQWLAKGLQEDIRSINDGKMLHRMTCARVPSMKVSDILALAVEKNQELKNTKIEKNNEPHVFIIDEINRGNISKIFGELITLIEDSKRAGMKEEASAILPYSGDKFSVPANVYIIGTMNTADRSIALMDTALRRRFSFVEMMPDSELLEDIKIDGIDIAKMLDTINQRITYLYDREHTIGHAFFMKLREEPTLEKLAEIFEKSIIPLLQEYFYEDYLKIQLVLGDNAKSDAVYKFIQEKETKVKEIFKGAAQLDLDLPEYSYTINKKAFLEAQSYIQIYE